MKRHIHPVTEEDMYTVSIEVEIELPENPSEDYIAAAEYNGFQLPDGPLLSGLPGALITSQELEDYAAFIESVKDLLTDYYNLQTYYHNVSEDNSHYFGLLAKDAAGNPIINFDFKLRVSNHPAHRSKQSQQHKSEQAAELKKVTKGKKTKPLTKSIIVNRETCANYTEAFIKVDKIVEEVVNVMRR